LLAFDTVNFTKYAQFKLCLEKKLETLRQVDSEILDLTEDDAIETEILQADENKDGISSVIVKLDEMILSTPVVSAATFNTISSVTPAAETSMTLDRDHRVKLPKLTIQPFDGNITSWMSFLDSYESAIHMNSAIANIDKFNYLHTFLRILHEIQFLVLL